MSLGHWPVMAFAKAGAAAHAHEMPITSGSHAHHAHAAQADHCQPSVPGSHEHGATDQVGLCNATGCFIVIAPPPIVAPLTGFALLARLAPAPARTMVPVSPDPADPPPRLQV